MPHSMQQEGISAAVESGEPEEEGGEEVGGRRLLRLRRGRVPRQDRQHREEEKEQARHLFDSILAFYTRLPDGKI